MNQNRPKSISELYPPRWLKPTDLPKPITATIAAVNVEDLYNPKAGEHQQKAVVSFQGGRKRLILNKTQCAAIEKITGSEVFTGWVGHAVTLSPGKAPSGQPTIVISKPKTQPAKPTNSGQPKPANGDAHTAFWAFATDNGIDKQIANDILADAGGDFETGLTGLAKWLKHNSPPATTKPAHWQPPEADVIDDWFPRNER